MPVSVTPSVHVGVVANLLPAQYVGSRTAINVLLTSPNFVGEAACSQYEAWSQVLHEMMSHSSAEPLVCAVNLTVGWDVFCTSSREDPIEVVDAPWATIDQLSEMKA